MTDRTVLYQRHAALGARFVDFHGVEMPIEYEGIVTEHQAVRFGVGIFDISHMGQIYLQGKDAHRFMQQLVTNDIRKLIPGKALYSPMCNEAGGIVDDIIVYMIKADEFLLVVNSATAEKDWHWIRTQVERLGLLDMVCEDQSAATGMIAVQGPHAVLTLEDLCQGSIADMGRYSFSRTKFKDYDIMLSRTGYTGEDGFEIFAAREDIGAIWDAVLAHESVSRVVPVGLGARNTLRLEACYLLYGSDMNDTTTPLEASLKWTVSFLKGDFIGRKALLEQEAAGCERLLVAFEMVDRGIPREGYTIAGCHDIIGEVTSGTFSPSLKKNIGLGYVAADAAQVGGEIAIIIRDNPHVARIVSRPFYRSNL